MTEMHRKGSPGTTREWYAIVLALLIAGIALYGCGATETPDNGAAIATRPASGGGGVTAPDGADRLAPSTPSGLSGNAVSPSQIDLGWTASTDDVGVAGYRVYRNGSLLSTLGDVTVFQDDGVTASTTYSYTVQAFDAAGNASPQSTAVIVTTPGAPDTTAPSTPTGLAAVAVSASRIDLSWSASTDNVGVVGYRVFRNGALLVALGNVTVYQDRFLTAGTTYIYTVRAIDGAGNESSSSAAASATTSTGLDTTPPTAPSNVVGNAVSPTQIDLTWTASTDNDVVAGYRVYRDGAFLVNVATTSYQDSGLNPSTSYTYNVDAVDASGNVSALSAPAIVSTPSAPDTNAPTAPLLGAVAISPSSIDLAWSGSTDNVAVTGYRIIRNGSLLTTLGDVTSFQDTGLVAATTYTYRVRAFDAAGNLSPQSNAASATTQATPDTTAPTVPTGLNAQAVSATKIDVSWSASTDNVGVTGYRVYRNGSFLIALGGVTTFQDTGLTPGTTYTYNVDAVDAVGNASGISAVAGATTLAINTATLAWDAVTASGLSGYRVYYGTAPGTYLQSPGNGISVGSVTTYTVSGLGRGLRYYFAVTAFDGSGNETTYSNEVFKDIP